MNHGTHSVLPLTSKFAGNQMSPYALIRITMIIGACWIGRVGAFESPSPGLQTSGTESSLARPNAPLSEIGPDANSGLWTEDANTSFSNKGLNIPWQNELGDWRDQSGARQGANPWAKATLVDDNKPNVVSFDVTAMLRSGNTADFFIRRVGGTDAYFHSSEAATARLRPTLTIDGIAYPITADTYVIASTVKSLGQVSTIRSAGSILMRADNAPMPQGTAVLSIYSTGSEYGTQELQVYAADPRKPIINIPNIPVVPLVNTYQISGADIYAKLSPTSKERAKLNPDNSVTGSMTWPGNLTVTDSIFRLPDAYRGDLVCEATIIRLEKGWRALAGKLPGLTNTGQSSPGSVIINGVQYNDAGWGGRGANGLRWSARTGFSGYTSANSTTETRNGHATYYYALDTPTVFGLQVAGAETIEIGKWVLKESCVKLNDIGQANGWHATWIDGRISVYETGIKWRTVNHTESLVNEYWADIYCGGTSCNNGTFKASIKAAYVAKGGRVDPTELIALVNELNRGISLPLPSGGVESMLSVRVEGEGVVTSTPAEVSCSEDCRYMYTDRPEMTLTATPSERSIFDSWSGACSGIVDCRIKLDSDTQIVAKFRPVERLGSIYPSQRSEGQSYLRFYNTGADAGTVTVTLAQSATGQLLTKWVSPTIPANAAAQFSIDTISGPITDAGPDTLYTATVEAAIDGVFQHVIERVGGTLTNASVCEGSTISSLHSLQSVASSSPQNTQSSRIVVNNTGAQAAAALLGVFDARDGTRLTTYETASIPAGAHVTLFIATIEADASIPLLINRTDYTVRVENDFDGFLQNFATSKVNGMTTDMTTVCAFGDRQDVMSSDLQLPTGPIYVSAGSSVQSFLRFFNAGSTSNTVTVVLRDPATGALLGTWTSPKIATNMSRQFSGASITAGLRAVDKREIYAGYVQAKIDGTMQHVLFRPIPGDLINRSSCASLTSEDNSRIVNVHFGALGDLYPSKISIINTSLVPLIAHLGIYDAMTGEKLGTYPTNSIPVRGEIEFGVAFLEDALQLERRPERLHLVIKAEGEFTGILQHFVMNSSTGSMVDMTTVCQLPERD